MFAAIVPHGGQLWFFKLVGPTEAVRKQSDPFSALVASVHFGNDAPQWTLPKDWKQLPASGTGAGRTLCHHSNWRWRKAARTVCDIPAQTGRRGRWRRRSRSTSIVGGARWGASRSTSGRSRPRFASEKRPTAGPLMFWDCLAEFQAGGMSRPPVAGASDSQMPAGHPSRRNKLKPVGRDSSDDPIGNKRRIEIRRPRRMAFRPSGGMRKAAFAVEDGSRSVSITVVVTEGSLAADIAANVNRWRGQFGLPAGRGERDRRDR